MNLKQRLLTTAAAAATLVGAVTAPAQAANMFGTSGISFDEVTTMKFDFLNSQGMWKDSFGIWDVSTGKFHYLFGEDLKAYDSPANDYKATVGKSLSKGDGTFTFEAGKKYALALDIRPTDGNGNEIAGKQRYAFSTDSMNGWTKDNQKGDGYSNQVKFDGGTSGDPFAGAVTIAFEDNPVDWNGDVSWVHIDHNDFMVKGQVVDSESVPEPATLLGLGLMGGAFALTRRRKAAQ